MPLSRAVVFLSRNPRPTGDPGAGPGDGQVGGFPDLQPGRGAQHRADVTGDPRGKHRRAQ